MSAQTVTNDESPIKAQAPAAHPAPESLPLEDSARCQHRFANRTRCRHLISPANPRFCPRHAALPQNMQPADLTPELIKCAADLDGLDGIYECLARLFILLAQNRVSTRRAAVLAYVINQLLRTFAAIRREQASAGPETVFGPSRPSDD